jgi:hypothetical protein
MRNAVPALAATVILGLSFAAGAAVQTNSLQYVNSLDRVAAKNSASTSDRADSISRLIAKSQCVGNCPPGNRPKRR